MANAICFHLDPPDTHPIIWVQNGKFKELGRIAECLGGRPGLCPGSPSLWGARCGTILLLGQTLSQGADLGEHDHLDQTQICVSPRVPGGTGRA